MNFGDILDKWDKIQEKEKLNKKNNLKTKSQIQVSHKKANALTKEEKILANQKEILLQENDSLKKSLKDQINQTNEQKINLQELWLRRYGVIDKDKIAQKEENVQHFKNINYSALKIDATIDLHGFTTEQSWNYLQSFVSECEYKGLKKILIIHGKGIHSNSSESILSDLVKKFIEQDKRLGASGHPNASNGGSGATWVILKHNLLK